MPANPGLQSSSNPSLQSLNSEIHGLKHSLSELLRIKKHSCHFILRQLQLMQEEPALQSTLALCIQHHTQNNLLIQSETANEKPNTIHLRSLLNQMLKEMEPVFAQANNRFADFMLRDQILHLHLPAKHLYSLLFECLWLLSNSVQNGIINFKNTSQEHEEAIVFETWRNSEQNTLIFDHWLDLETRLPVLNELLHPHKLRLEISEFDSEHFSLSLLYPKIQHSRASIQVLALDDDESNLNLIAHILKEDNYSLQCFSQAEQALSYCHAHPDLEIILLDLVMPQSNGFEISKQMSRICPKAKIIAVTSLALEDHFEAWMQSGLHDLINKPISRSEFLQKIQCLSEN